MRLVEGRWVVFVGACFGVLLVASAQATEPPSADGDGCFHEAEPERSAEQRGYTGQRISLDFKDADIVNVLRMLSEVGGENIVVTDDVKGRVTVRLVDVPWDQALDVVLQANRLQCIEIGNVRRVSTVLRLEESQGAPLATLQPPRNQRTRR